MRRKLSIMIAMTVCLILAAVAMTACTPAASDSETAVAIRINNFPESAATVYQGDGLSLDGCSIMVDYESGASAVIPMSDPAVSVDGFSVNTVGTQTITITYLGMSVTAEVEVLPLAVTDVAIDSMPEVITVVEGGELSVDGISLRITYQNGRSVVMDRISADMVTGYSTSLSAGVHTVYVNYYGFALPVEIVVEELATRMAAQGHEVTLLNRKRRKYPRVYEYMGCKVESVFTIEKRSLDAIVYAFFATLRARRMIKKGQADIVHFHAEGPCLFLSLLPRRKKRPGTKVVVTIHGLDWQRGKWGGFASRVLRMGERRAVKYADEIIVLSNSNKAYFRETYDRETKYIPNGVPPPELRAPDLIQKKYGLSSNGYVLFLARIVPEKGLHYLIPAWKSVVRETGTEKKLVIAGAPSHSDGYYREICAMAEGDESIVMTGYVEGRELQELYSNACLYVLPSDIEGMPIGFLEALSYGNVCLVSDIPENMELVNENCYVFRRGDVNRLRHQIKKIIGQDVSHRSAVIPYTWQEVVRRTLEIYVR